MSALLLLLSFAAAAAMASRLPGGVQGWAAPALPVLARTASLFLRVVRERINAFWLPRVAWAAQSAEQTVAKTLPRFSGPARTKATFFGELRDAHDSSPCRG